MPTLVFVHADGREESRSAVLGQSVMECAVDGRVGGMRGQCGGAATCGTCHCYVDAAWHRHLLPPIDDEVDLLPYLPHVRANSRLACQIRVSAALDGIRIGLPPDQSSDQA